MVILWKLRTSEGILSELLCAGLCDTMFTVSSTFTLAVLTGVCHMLRVEAVA